MKITHNERINACENLLECTILQGYDERIKTAILVYFVWAYTIFSNNNIMWRRMI